jgi:hypothetical protein
MEIGDIVRQNNALLVMKRKGKIHKVSMLGTVVAIHVDHQQQMTEYQRKWFKRLGKRVDVLWANGKLTEGFAEAALDIIVDSCDKCKETKQVVR